MVCCHTFHHSSTHSSAVVTAGTTCRNTRMVHRPGCKTAGDGSAGMARLARSRGRNMIRRFGRNTGILATMAAGTSCRNAGMVKCRPQKTGGAGMT